MNLKKMREDNIEKLLKNLEINLVVQLVDFHAKVIKRLRKQLYVKQWYIIMSIGGNKCYTKIT